MPFSHGVTDEIEYRRGFGQVGNRCRAVKAWVRFCGCGCEFVNTHIS